MDSELTTLLRSTSKRHTSLPRTQVELLNLLGNHSVQPRTLMAAWNSHHHAQNNDIAFAEALLALVSEGYIVTEQVILEPKPAVYAGTLTVRPDGTAVFVTNKLQYGRKLTLHVKGIDLDSTSVTTKVVAQSK